MRINTIILFEWGLHWVVQLIHDFFSFFIENYKHQKWNPGADPGFQVRGGGAVKKIAPSGGRR